MLVLNKISKQYNISLLLILYCLFSNNIILIAQPNLVPNYSFETYTVCPKVANDPPPPPWYMPTRADYQYGTYANSCSSEIFYASVPYNSCGFQYARTGQAYSIVVCHDLFNINSERAYQQVKLLDSLKNGKCYYAEFYVSLTNSAKYGCNNVAMLFTNSPKYVDTLTDPRGVIIDSPQINNYGNPIITDTLNWVKVSGIFTAQGGEQYITIGNFKTDSQTKKQLINNAVTNIFYGSNYYIDDISVIPIDSFTLKADAGVDKIITLGDSVFIGSLTNGITNLIWYNSGGTPLNTQAPGLYVTPTSNTFYILEQVLCGSYYSSDTVFITVNPVPLKFISYNVIARNEKSIENLWVTANEINVSHFNIQRSSNAKDFYTIQKVAAKNNSYNEYNFIDMQPLFGDSYYRIESVDKDGKKNYTETKKISIINSQLSIIIYPNPAKDVLNIISKQNIKNIKIINQLGQVLQQINNPTEHQTINIKQFSKGIFILQIATQSGEISTQKLVIQ